MTGVEFPDGDRLEIRLDCTGCDRMTDYEVRDSDPGTVVRCAVCGKRHSKDSLHAV